MKGTNTLTLAVLGLLHESPMHGYELRKRLTLLLGPFRALSYGSLYPALKKLKASGLIAESLPEENLVTRRAKRVYNLTEEGIQTFNSMLNDSTCVDVEGSGFDVHLAFFSHTPATIRIYILEGRRRYVEARRAHLLGLLSRKATTVESYSRGLKQLELESAERELEWLNNLIDVEYSSKPTAKTTPARLKTT